MAALALQEGFIITEANENHARVTLDMRGPLARVSFENPARMNALSASMWAAIPDTLRVIEETECIRAAIFRGAGNRAFSAGADISEFESARSGENVKDYNALNHAAFEALANCVKPTVAMIHGFCLGGGLGLALACDLRIADDKATFAIPAAKLGLGYNPRWMRSLLAAVTPARAKEMLFTARRFSAAEALAMGLVHRVVSSETLEAETEALAAEIAANAPLTIQAAKRAIDGLARDGGAADMGALERLVDDCFESADYAEGRRAFAEKRKPRFEGR